MIIPTKIVVHHTAHKTWTFDDVKKYHVEVNGWKDIGYNYFVEKTGEVKVGRGLEQGAHVKGYNDTTLGYGFAGNFEEEYPTKAQYLGAANHMALLMAAYGLKEQDVIGHKDLAATLCPGKNFDMQYFRTLLSSILPHAKDIHELAQKGIINSPAVWIRKLNEPMPVWAVMALANRITNK